MRRAGIVFLFILLLMYLCAFMHGRDIKRGQVVAIQAMLLDDYYDGYDKATNELTTMKAEYKDQLISILNTVYARDARSIGGYTFDAENDISMVYDAIITAELDYRELLDKTENYFEVREHYLEGIPSIWPVPYSSSIYITSGYGPRYSPITGRLTFHPAIDIAGPITTPIIATASGTVVEHWPAPNGYWKGHDTLGGCVVIQHDNGYTTEYAHMRKTFVTEGQEISRGDVLGYMGSTGASTGPHVHYEVRQNGALVNPMELMKF